MSISDDIEKVARALCRHDALPYLTDDGVDGYVETYWRKHLDAARVAMQATRDCDAEEILFRERATWNRHEIYDWLMQRAAFNS